MKIEMEFNREQANLIQEIIDDYMNNGNALKWKRIMGSPSQFSKLDEIIGEESLSLKWGTLKRWDFHSEKAKELLEEYFKLGSNMSAIAQKDTPRQKEIICELIDIGNFTKVYLDFDDEDVSKEDAKNYVLNYGKGER